MGPEELDGLLRESVYFRSTLVDLLQSSEQTLAIAVAALARQVDLGRLSADLLALQREAAVDEPNPIRDRQLNAIRSRLHPPLAD
ncbi:MAG: hypothetical protein R3E40_08505 [Rhodocyclaceae bacterium]|nr:hypothetical protein [Zoogloeaceae bacterium]MCW5595662.1 hypothetical protein [Rhodocyclaceae bacterium]PKO71679.1 MAG: hypothetical protein CVU20_05910 [Betaproteobacteria bacterium HGW-Betaproteobacteria-14]